MRKTIGDVLTKQSPRVILFIGFVLTAVVGWMDFMTGYEVSVSILYLGPISLVTWYAGRVPGFSLAVTSAVVWLLADLATGRSVGHVLIPYWNGVVILGEFLVVAMFVHRLQVAHANNVRMIGELQEAATKIRTLTGLIPICASCKKIRDDQGYWHQIEVYIRDHSEADFSHSLCPDCARRLYPNLYKDR